MQETTSTVAQRLHAMTAISTSLLGELKDLAGKLSAFSDAPKAQPLSPSLGMMYRAATFCGFWGVANYLGGLRELAMGIENVPPETVERAEFVDRVRTLAAGVNALGMYLRDLSGGSAVPYAALNEQFGRVLRKARPQMLELTPAEAAPLLFMPAPPSMEVDAHWVAKPGASREALLIALETVIAEAPTEMSIRAVAHANPYRTLAGMFESAACQHKLVVMPNAREELIREVSRLYKLLGVGAPMVPPTPDAFLFSRLMFSLVSSPSADAETKALRRRYALTKPGANVASMHDVARKFLEGIKKFQDAYVQATLSKTPSIIGRLAASVLADSHRLESTAFTTVAALMVQLTRNWASEEPTPDGWTRGAALVLLLQESAETWGQRESQEAIASLADLMGATEAIFPCESMQLTLRAGAIRKACEALSLGFAELHKSIELSLRSVGNGELDESKAARVAEVLGAAVDKQLKSVAGAMLCLQLPLAAAYADRLRQKVFSPELWAQGNARTALFDDLARLQIFLARLRPGSMLDLDLDEQTDIPALDLAADDKSQAQATALDVAGATGEHAVHLTTSSERLGTRCTSADSDVGLVETAVAAASNEDASTARTALESVVVSASAELSIARGPWGDDTGAPAHSDGDGDEQGPVDGAGVSVADAMDGVNCQADLAFPLSALDSLDDDLVGGGHDLGGSDDIGAALPDNVYALPLDLEDAKAPLPDAAESSQTAETGQLAEAVQQESFLGALDLADQSLLGRVVASLDETDCADAGRASSEPSALDVVASCPHATEAPAERLRLVTTGASAAAPSHGSVMEEFAFGMDAAFDGLLPPDLSTLPPEVLAKEFADAQQGRGMKLEAADPELLTIMFEESWDCMDAIDEALGRARHGGAEADGSVPEARRQIHTLKGVCRTVGLDALGAMLHAMEGRLEVMPDDGLLLSRFAGAFETAMAVVRSQLEEVRASCYDGSVLHGPHTMSPPDSEAEVTATAAAVALGLPESPLNEPAPTGGETEPAPVPDPVPASSAADDGAAHYADQGGPARTAVPGDLEAVGTAVEDAAAECLPAAERVGTITPRARFVELESTTSGASIAQAMRAVSPPSGGTVRIPVQLAGAMGQRSGQVLIASRRALEDQARAARAMRELEENLRRMAPAIRELELMASTSIASSLAQGQMAGFDPLELDRYTQMQEVVRRLSEAFEDATGSAVVLTDGLRASQAAEQLRADMSDELQRGASELLMVPVASQQARLERVVAKACADAGRRAELIIEPGCRVPAATLDKLMPVFEHILRNALAHGIEDGVARVAAGKAAVGKLVIGAPLADVAEGGVVRVCVRDDGAGIDLARVLATAVKRGLVGPGAQISEDATRELLFTPGFSTAGNVSELAGRGVGLDVVRSSLSSLGGVVSVSSRPGGGTEFTLTLPTDAASMAVVPVTSAGFKCLIPLTLVRRIVPVSAGVDVEIDLQAGTAIVAGVELELVDMSRRVRSTGVGTKAGRGHLVLMRESSVVKAVLVDSVGQQTRVVVKPLGPFVRDIPGMVAGTTMAAGGATLVVNPLHLPEIGRHVAGEVEAESVARVMVVDDSSTVRLVTSRFLKRCGLSVDTARDGLEALQLLNKGARPDVFLFDLEMPGMGGFELISEVRRRAEFAKTPILVISSRTADKHRERAVALGATTYLAKPYEDVHLHNALARFVRVSALNCQ